MSNFIIKKELNFDDTTTYYTEKGKYIVDVTPDHYLIFVNGFLKETVEKLDKVATGFSADEGIKITAAMNYSRLVKALKDIESNS